MAQAGLANLEQTDWSGGIFRARDHRRIPPNGAYDIINGLIDDNGDLYRRGGSAYKSSAGFSSAGLRWVWDGYFDAGRRTLFADDAGFGTLSEDDVTPLRLALPSGFSMPTAPRFGATHELGDVLWMALGTGRPLVYGGSRKPNVYSTGSVSGTSGDDLVNFSGTSLLDNADAGMILRRGSSSRIFVVDEVISNTQVRLSDKSASKVGTGSYTLGPLGVADGSNYVDSKNKGDVEALGVVGKRVLVSDGSRVWFSKYGKPHDNWQADDYHKMPEAARVTAIADARGVALVFTTRGLWGIYNLEQNIVDTSGNPQQRLQLQNGELILWGPSGLANYQGGVIAPCLDGVWIVYSGLLREQPPQRISTSITDLYLDYIDGGYYPGAGITYRNHYLLPIVDGVYNVIDVLVCRLDRPVNVGGAKVYPWTRLEGTGAQMTAYAQKTGSAGQAKQPALFGAQAAAESRVIDCTGYFEPDESIKTDHDGENVELSVTSRDFPTGQGESLNTVRRARVRSELVAVDNDYPTGTLAFASENGDWTDLAGFMDPTDTVDSTPATPAAAVAGDYRTTILATTGLAAYFRLADTNNRMVDQKSSTKGYYVNGPTVATSLLSGDRNAAHRFDGTNDYAYTDDRTQLDLGDIFTLECWIKRERTGVTEQILSKTGAYTLRMNSNNKVCLRRGGVADVVESTITITDTLRHYIAVTKQGSTVKLYIDGTDRTGVVTNQTFTNNSNNFGLAYGEDGASFFKGAIDEVALYGTDLSAAQIASHYSVGTTGTAVAGTPPTVTDFTSNVKTWRIDKKMRYVRYKFSTTGPAAGCRLKAIETFVRQAGWDR